MKIINALFSHPWWVILWLLIIFDGIGSIGKRIIKSDKEAK